MDPRFDNEDFDRMDAEYGRIDPIEPAASDSKGWAAAAHLVPLIGLSFIAPLVIWLIKRDEDEFVSFHAKEALNFQLTLLIAYVVGAITLIFVIGIIILIAAVIGGFVLMIIGGVKAAGGETWRYPLNIRFVK